jgi:Flp pilus assembly protein TadG
MTYITPKSLLRALRRDDGNSSIEFTMIFPIFIVLFLSVIEMGVMMTRYMMFERGLDITVRELRLDAEGTYTKDDIRNAICNETLIVGNCQTGLTLEMVRLDNDAENWSFPQSNAVCTNRFADVEPSTSFTPGSSHDTMYLRACMSVEPMFPWAGLGASLVKDENGTFNMIAQSAFAVEPL